MARQKLMCIEFTENEITNRLEILYIDCTHCTMTNLFPRLFHNNPPTQSALRTIYEDWQLANVKKVSYKTLAVLGY